MSAPEGEPEASGMIAKAVVYEDTYRALHALYLRAQRRRSVHNKMWLL